MKRTYNIYLVCLFLGFIISCPTFGLIIKDIKIEMDVQKSRLKKIKNENYFIENRGQLIDQFGISNFNVLYYANLKNYNILISKDKFSIEIFENSLIKEDEIKCHRVEYILDNVNLNSTFNNISDSSISLNYLNGEKGLNRLDDLKTFKTIKLCEIYPHIDVEFQILDGQFKYNFIVNPGGHIEDIKIKIDGSVNNKIDSCGKLEILTSVGTIEDYVPLVYTLNQDNSSNRIIGKFIEYTKNGFSFEIDAFDTTKQLVIDPAPWVTFFGGGGKEELIDLAVSSSGFIYISGNTTSTSNIATSGAFQNIISGSKDLFVSKLSITGQLIWSTYIGGNGAEFYGKIAIDSLSNLYITGGTNSQAGISTIGAHQTIYGGGSSSVYLIKLDSNGFRKWATYLGGNSGQYATSIAISKNSEIYISGTSHGGDTLMTTSGSMNRYGSGPQDVFIEKFNSDGLRIWGTYYGGINTDIAYDLAVDDVGFVFVTGITSSDTGIAYGNSFQKNRSNDFDGFILKLNPQGHFIWGTYFGGDSTDYLYSISLDKIGNAYCTGFTKSKNGISGLNSFQQNLNGSMDALVIKLDSIGNKIWSTYFGYEGNEMGYQTTTDLFGNVYIAGFTNSPDSLPTQNGYQVNYGGGGLDGFILKLSPFCTKSWASYIGGDGIDEIQAIAIKDSNELLFVGNSTSISGISTNGTYQVINAGNQDGIIGLISISSNATEILNNYIERNQNICQGNPIDTIIGSNPVGGNGLFSYKWIVSSIDSVSNFSALSNSNSKNILPVLINKVQYYRRIVYSDIFSDTSNAVRIQTANKLNVGFTINKKIQCVKDNLFIFNDTTIGSTKRYWDLGNGDTSSLKNVSVSYKPSIDNAIRVKLISYSDTNCMSLKEDVVYLISNPQTSGILGDTIPEININKQYSVVNRDGSTYTWIFKNGIGVSNKNQISIKWIYPGYDTIKVVEKSANSCNGDTISIKVNVKLKNEIEEFLLGYKLNLTPNPTNGKCYIMDPNFMSGTYKVTNSLGIAIFEGNLSINLEGNIEFDFVELEDGIYYLHLFSNLSNKVGNSKFMISH